MAEPMICCKNLTLKYGSFIAVDNVSFHVCRQDYLCIVGKNGSGKSTLIKGILGLSKPTSGQIVFSGIKQAEIGYLPQQTQVQADFPASVYEIVISGRLNQHKFLPFYSRRDKECAYQNLHCLGIEALARKSYRDLSGGQQQRVLLARALCAGKKLLVLDEPTVGIDRAATNALYDLLEKLNQSAGLTIMMVSHDLENALKFGTKILHLQTAALYFGTKADYANSKPAERLLGGEADA